MSVHINSSSSFYTFHCLAFIRCEPCSGESSARDWQVCSLQLHSQQLQTPHRDLSSLALLLRLSTKASPVSRILTYQQVTSSRAASRQIEKEIMWAVKSKSPSVNFLDELRSSRNVLRCFRDAGMTGGARVNFFIKIYRKKIDKKLSRRGL